MTDDERETMERVETVLNVVQKLAEREGRLVAALRKIASSDTSTFTGSQLYLAGAKDALDWIARIAEEALKV